MEHPELLDYEVEERRHFVFKVNAIQSKESFLPVPQDERIHGLLETPTGEEVLSSATVTVLVTDSNDNEPVFAQQVHEFIVREDAPPGTSIGNTSIVCFVALFDSGMYSMYRTLLSLMIRTCPHSHPTGLHFRDDHGDGRGLGPVWTGGVLLARFWC